MIERHLLVYDAYTPLDLVGNSSVLISPLLPQVRTGASGGGSHEVTRDQGTRATASTFCDSFTLHPSGAARPSVIATLRDQLQTDREYSLWRGEKQAKPRLRGRTVRFPRALYVGPGHRLLPLLRFPTPQVDRLTI